MKISERHKELIVINKIIVIYAVFSSLWIYFSDTVLGVFLSDKETFTRFSVYKGFCFVVITSILLRQLVVRYVLESKQLKEEIRNKDLLVSEYLLASKLQYDNLVARINVGIYILQSTSDGTYSLNYISPRMAELLGYSTETLLSDREIWFKNIYPADLDHFLNLNQKKIKQCQPFDIIIRYQIDGTIKSLHFESIPEKLPNGDILWHGVVSDVTNRQETEKNLRALYRTQALRSKISQATVHSHVEQKLFDDVCRIAVEQGGFRMSWIGIMDVQTKQIVPVAHAGKVDDYLEKLDIVMDESVKGHGPSALAIRAGSHTVVNDIASDTRMAPWRDDALRIGYRSSANFPFIVGGEVRGMLNLYADEPNFFNQEELELLDEIADDITFALKFIENEKKREQVQKELEKHNAEMGQFIYTVSHDLRSPLVTVKTFMGYLEKDLDAGNQEQAAQDIQFIHGAADKMKLLLDELLDMSRIGRAESEPVRVSFLEVMAESLETLAGVISEQKVSISLPETDLILLGDRQRLCQIWQNLIENAIKYSGYNGPPRIEIGIQQLGEETVFFIKDEGIGIEPQYHQKIFGIFEKLNSKSAGAGMGLSMVQKIVEKNNGRVWVESEGIGKGSCFCFTLPQAVVQDSV